jgi:prepilin signal peptidase PulO-like enzyme (type II secretory pathway)
MGIVKTIVSLFIVGFAIYLFFLMVTNIDFKGMSFSEIKLVISICLGVAVSLISGKAGTNIIQSALLGFVVGAIFLALIQTVIQMISG